MRCVQAIQGKKEDGKGKRLGGAKSHQRNNFGQPWNILLRLRGGVLVGKWASSRNQKGEEERVGKSACWD